MFGESTGMFGCHNSGTGGDSAGVQWVETRDTAKYCTLSLAARPTTESYPVQNDGSAEAEEPWSRRTVL